MQMNHFLYLPIKNRYNQMSDALLVRRHGKAAAVRGYDFEKTKDGNCFFLCFDTYRMRSNILERKGSFRRK